MTIRFKYSKADPFGKGHIVTLHATNTLTCPVQAMRHYLKLRSYHAQSPLFLLADGTVLTRFKFITSLRCLPAKVGLQAELYAGHSFRIGAATTAAAAGLPDWLIQAMGRWSSECYKRYIRLTNTSLRQACLEMAHTTHICKRDIKRRGFELRLCDNNKKNQHKNKNKTKTNKNKNKNKNKKTVTAALWRTTLPCTFSSTNKEEYTAVQ